MTPTEALYLDDATLHSVNTKVISYEPLSSLGEAEKALAKNVPLDKTYAVITKQTVFYPQGGGQASDTGTITRTADKHSDSESDGNNDNDARFEVVLVRKTSDGSILHFGRFPAGSQPQPAWLIENAAVSLQLDVPKRDYHSRLHTAGHILGLAMRLLSSELGSRKKLKANHFPGEASLEFEGLLYNEHKPLIQAKVDEIVELNLEVRTSWWDESEVERRREELDMVEGREIGGMGSGKVRIAEIGDLDANPCGGTHVERTGKTGKIMIRKISRQKGATRVSYAVPVSLDGE